MTKIKQTPKVAWNKGLKTGLVPSTAFKKGIISFNKGKTWEERLGKDKAAELKKTLSLRRKGVPPTNKGIKTGLIPKNAFLKGDVSTKKGKTYEEMYGKERTKQLRNNHSMRMKGFTPWNKGKIEIYSEETIKKMKEARALQIVPMRDTSIEVKIQNFLKQLGIQFYTHQYMKEIDHSYQCDILIPSMSLVIECDGNYWHKYPIGKEIDHIRTSELIERGFKVLRLWEHEIRNMSLDNFNNLLENHSIKYNTAICIREV